MINVAFSSSSITTSGQYKQPIKQTGDTQFTRLPLPLKSNIGASWKTKEEDKRPGPFWNKQWNRSWCAAAAKRLAYLGRFHQPSAACTRLGLPPSCIFIREAEPWLWCWIWLASFV